MRMHMHKAHAHAHAYAHAYAYAHCPSLQTSADHVPIERHPCTANRPTPILSRSIPLKTHSSSLAVRCRSHDKEATLSAARAKGAAVSLFAFCEAIREARNERPCAWSEKVFLTQGIFLRAAVLVAENEGAAELTVEDLRNAIREARARRARETSDKSFVTQSILFALQAVISGSHL